MFVVEQIGHEGVGRSYWRILEATSVGCDPLVGVDGEELCEGVRIRGRADGGNERKETCVVRMGIVIASSPFKLATVGGQEHSRAV